VAVVVRICRFLPGSLSGHGRTGRAAVSLSRRCKASRLTYEGKLVGRGDGWRLFAHTQQPYVGKFARVWGEGWMRESARPAVGLVRVS
jgi:hypothetical protein